MRPEDNHTKTPKKKNHLLAASVVAMLAAGLIYVAYRSYNNDKSGPPPSGENTILDTQPSQGITPENPEQVPTTDGELPTIPAPKLPAT